MRTRRYNEDATQRADAQRVLTLTQERINSANRAAAGRMAVTGGTEESVAATKAANARGFADAAARIAANEEKRKDAVERQYLERDAELNRKLADIEQGRAKAVSEAVSGASEAGSDLSSLIKK